MRLILLAVSIACAACATGPAAESIAGNWSSWGPNQSPTPAGPMGLTLSESGDTVNGVGSWAVEHWRVNGQYMRPNITLTLTSALDGKVSSWTGKAIDADKIELNGTTFYRQ